MNKHKKRSKLNCNFEHQKDIFKKIRFAVIKYNTYKIIENKFHQRNESLKRATII